MFVVKTIGLRHFRPKLLRGFTTPGTVSSAARLINQLRRFTTRKACIWIRWRGNFLLKQTGKDFCCLGAAYLFVRVSDGGFKVLTRFKVKEGLLGLR